MPAIEIGSAAGLADSFFIREMKDYRKMSRPELLALVAQLKSKHARRSRTQKRQAAEVLSDREERLRAILNTAVEGIITIDHRGIIESVNPAAQAIFGYRAAELIGKNVSVLMPQPDRAAHDGYLANYLRTGQARIIGIGREVTGRRKDGSLFPMELSVSEVKLRDRTLFTGFIRDISARKQLERQILEVSDREQRRIGHDLHDGLCQHLAGIELMSQVLEKKLAPKFKDGAARAAHIARLVRDAIVQTRSLARGLSPVTLESEGLASALHEHAVTMEKMFRVRCRFDYDSQVPVPSHALATHLFRFAQEAVSNAINHGKATDISIHLKADPGWICLGISDNGTGFAPEAIARSKGMGLRIMKFRAGMVGGTFTIERNAQGGVLVICSAPNPSPV